MRGRIIAPWERFARVVLLDAVETPYHVDVPRDGHTDNEVRSVAYRWACKEIAEGKLRPAGELRFARITSAD
jgi:hypothetical protein